jgi:hypothetical protein
MPPTLLSNLPKGNSPTALYLDTEAGAAKRQHFESSATFGKQSAYSELSRIWQACQSPNWDGDGAYPVETATLQNTYALINALPLGYPLPSVGVEPDGHLTLEWYRHPRWILSVSVSSHGILYYAALFGTNEARGSEVFWGEVPQRLLELIRHVQMA